jgi:triacylglycerol lipase
MKASGRVLVVVLWVLGALGVLAVGAGVLLHLPAAHRHLAHLHGAGAGGESTGGFLLESGPESEASTRAREGVAALGRRWDAAAFAETVALYTAVHRDLEWPGLLTPETVQYGPDARQTFELFRPEQGFSEPGPVFVFMHGNGLGSGDRVAPGSDGLLYSHTGKLAATFGGLGVNMSYRTRANAASGASAANSASVRAADSADAADSANGADSASGRAAGAEDLRLVIEWIVEHIAPYGGDPETIVLLANSEGATTAAAYLFNEEWQTSSGPRLAAAILSSGLFGALAPEIEQAVDAYAGAPVPLALWSGELDTVEVEAGIMALHDQLCEKHGDCPWFERLEGHNHVSHVMSLGTPDTSVLSAFIRFYHTVR